MNCIILLFTVVCVQLCFYVVRIFVSIENNYCRTENINICNVRHHLMEIHIIFFYK